MNGTRRVRLLPLLLCLSALACMSEVDDDAEAENDIEEVAEVSQSISNGWVSYAPGVLRMDQPANNNKGWRMRCSAFFIAPNMIATAGHCVHTLPSAGASGTRDGMMWREVRLRFVYKPSSSEVMCINEPCRNSDNSPRFTTVRAWWVNGYGGNSGGHDFAVITRVQGYDFPTRPAAWGGTAPRALSDGDDDFYRLLDGRTSGNTPLGIRGYGAYGDSNGTDLKPRYGWLYLDWWGPIHVVSDAGRESRICAGDSGGPLYYAPNVWSRGYVIGVASGGDSYDGYCFESGDKMRWARVESKRWMMNSIMGWANRPGRTSCVRTPANLPGDGGFYRCW